MRIDDIAIVGELQDAIWMRRQKHCRRVISPIGASPCVTAGFGMGGGIVHKIITIIDMENEKPKSTLNRYVRYIYRKLMREHGVEKVREEALRVYCLTTPERARVRKESATMLSTEFLKSLFDLCLEWGINPKHLNETLAGTAYYSPEELEEVLLDLTPLRVRIRKLTVRECMRLQGVTDEDTDKMMAAGISNSAGYKLAGNSICVPVLEGIFTQLFRQDSDCLF